MLKRFLMFVLCLLSCICTISEIRAQPRLYSCSRAEIETYPEAERRPILEFFNDARETTDKSAKLLVDGKIDELYSTMSPAEKTELSGERFHNIVEDFEKRFGKMLDYEYRGQSLTTADPRELDLHEVITRTSYAVRTNIWNEGAVLFIDTRKNIPVTYFTGVDMIRFDPSFPLEKRFPKATGERCTWFGNPLRIKAQD